MPGFLGTINKKYPAISSCQTKCLKWPKHQPVGDNHGMTLRFSSYWKDCQMGETPTNIWSVPHAKQSAWKWPKHQPVGDNLSMPLRFSSYRKDCQRGETPTNIRSVPHAKQSAWKWPKHQTVGDNLDMPLRFSSCRKDCQRGETPTNTWSWMTICLENDCFASILQISCNLPKMPVVGKSCIHWSCQNHQTVPGTGVCNILVCTRLRFNNCQPRSRKVRKSCQRGTIASDCVFGLRCVSQQEYCKRGVESGRRNRRMIAHD